MSPKKTTIIKFGEFSYKPSTSVLRRNGEEVTPRLTPTQARILEFLYSNGNRTVSRDELLNYAASGRVVGADNVNQHIKNLRKALGDPVNKSRYISTQPNAGYRFIAEVEEASETGWLQSTLKPVYVLPFVVSAISLLWIAFNVVYEDNGHSIQTPITSLKGQEIDGHAIKGGEYFIFSHKLPSETNWNLTIKTIGKENYFRLTDDDFNDRRAKFSPSGNQLIYHHYDNNVSQLLIAQIDWTDKKLADIKVLSELPKGQLSVFFDWKDEKTVFFSNSDSSDQPYYIAEIDIITRQLQRLTTPSGNGHGDLAVAYSEIADQLAILRNVGWSKTDIMLYDPNSQQISKLASLPFILLSAAWNNKGTGLFLRTGTGKLGLLNVTDGKIEEIHVSNSPVYAPFVLSDDAIGFMRDDLIASDVFEYDLSGNEKAHASIVSSFRDSLPAVAQTEGSIAFVSTRSGQHQIWMKTPNNELRQISHFAEPPRILNLAIDHEAKYIAYSANAELHLMDIESGEILFSTGSEEHEYDNPVFSDDGKYILYSLKNEGRWQLEKRNIDDMQIRTVLTEGYIAKPSKSMDCVFFLKHNDATLYKLTASGEVENTGVDLGVIQFVDQLHVVENGIYFTSKVSGQKKLLHHDLQTGRREVITAIPSIRFAMNRAQKLAYWTVQTRQDTNLEEIKIASQ